METNKKKNDKTAKETKNFVSADGLVAIVTKTTTARRFPQHDYPVVCLHLRPKKGSRVQNMNNGSGGLDCLLRHTEVTALLKALNQADSKSAYSWTEIPEKPAQRKAYWDQFNRERKRCCR